MSLESGETHSFFCSVGFSCSLVGKCTFVKRKSVRSEKTRLFAAMLLKLPDGCYELRSHAAQTDCRCFCAPGSKEPTTQEQCSPSMNFAMWLWWAALRKLRLLTITTQLNLQDENNNREKKSVGLLVGDAPDGFWWDALIL